MRGSDTCLEYGKAVALAWNTGRQQRRSRCDPYDGGRKRLHHRVGASLPTRGRRGWIANEEVFILMKGVGALHVCMCVFASKDLVGDTLSTAKDDVTIAHLQHVDNQYIYSFCFKL